jgi:hypothetical protein
VEQLLENFDSSSARVGISSSFQILPSTEESIEEGRNDWQAWQMQKDLALLAVSSPERWRDLRGRSPIIPEVNYAR